MRLPFLIIGFVSIFGSGIYFGVVIQKNRSTAHELSVTTDQLNQAIQERNTVLEATHQLIASNVALDQKITAWNDQYQQESRSLYEKVQKEVSKNYLAYRCRIPDHGLRLLNEARHRTSNYSTTSKLDETVPSSPQPTE